MRFFVLNPICKIALCLFSLSTLAVMPSSYAVSNTQYALSEPQVTTAYLSNNLALALLPVHQELYRATMLRLTSPNNIFFPERSRTLRNVPSFGQFNR